LLLKGSIKTSIYMASHGNGSLTSNGTWEHVALLPGKKTVCCKWVYTINLDGSIERLKAHLVAKGIIE
jgi:hypothetical protein